METLAVCFLFEASLEALILLFRVFQMLIQWNRKAYVTYHDYNLVQYQID